MTTRSPTTAPSPAGTAGGNPVNREHRPANTLPTVNSGIHQDS
ncbi:hypothetical protein [Streptomyces akebiae]|nr:hypothetical protein [Streptomyces akebiae]